MNKSKPINLKVLKVHPVPNKPNQRIVELSKESFEVAKLIDEKKLNKKFENALYVDTYVELPIGDCIFEIKEKPYYGTTYKNLVYCPFDREDLDPIKKAVSKDLLSEIKRNAKLDKEPITGDSQTGSDEEESPIPKPMDPTDPEVKLVAEILFTQDKVEEVDLDIKRTVKYLNTLLKTKEKYAKAQSDLMKKFEKLSLKSE